jgi:hypothetical protein
MVGGDFIDRYVLDNDLFGLVFVILIKKLIHIKVPISEILQIIALIILPNEFFELFQTIKQGNSPAPIHESRFKYPQIW